MKKVIVISLTVSALLGTAAFVFAQHAAAMLTAGALLGLH